MTNQMFLRPLTGIVIFNYSIPAFIEMYNDAEFPSPYGDCDS